MNNEVIDALEEQVACYRRLAKLTELQHQHVQQDQTESLLEVLKKRQIVVNEIMRLEGLVSPSKRGWNDYVRGIDADLRDRAEALVTETRLLLQQITQADQNDALVLQQRKLNLGKQINQTKAAGQVNRQYATAAYGTRPARMDLQR